MRRWNQPPVTDSACALLAIGRFKSPHIHLSAPFRIFIMLDNILRYRIWGSWRLASFAASIKSLLVSACNKAVVISRIQSLLHEHLTTIKHLLHSRPIQNSSLYRGTWFTDLAETMRVTFGKVGYFVYLSFCERFQVALAQYADALATAYQLSFTANKREARIGIGPQLQTAWPPLGLEICYF